MPVEVEANGEIYEFPDEMPPEQIQAAMRKRFPTPAPAAPPSFGDSLESDIGSGDPLRLAGAQQRIADQVLGMTKTGLETGKLTPEQKERALREDAGVVGIDPLTKFASGMSSGITKGLDTPEKLALSGADFLLGAVGAGETGVGRGVSQRLKDLTEKGRLIDEQDREMFGEGDIAGNLGTGVGQAAVELPWNLIPGAGAKTAAQAVRRSAGAAAAIGGGSQYAQERGEGKGRDVAALQGVVSGAITGATTGRFGATGVESIFKKAGPTGLMNAVREGLKDAGMEFSEESIDQMQQDLVARITKNPDKPIFESFKEVMMAGGVGAILGGAVSGTRGVGETAVEALDERSYNRRLDKAITEDANLKAVQNSMPDTQTGQVVPVDLEKFNATARAQLPEGAVVNLPVSPRTARATKNAPGSTPESPVVPGQSVAPEVQQFIADYYDPNKKISNASDDPSVTTTRATGMAVKSLADLDALTEMDGRNKAELAKFKARMDAGEKPSPEEMARFHQVAMRIQFPREVIETAVNAGSWAEEMDASLGIKLPPRPLDWKKNPEVAEWLKKNAKTIGIQLPAELVKPTKVTPPVKPVTPVKPVKPEKPKGLTPDEVFEAAKATPDEFSGVDATHLSKKERRALVERGLSFNQDRNNRIIATYPARMRQEDLKKAVKAKAKAAKPKKPRGSFFIRPRSDGIVDILDAIQTEGGLQVRREGDTGGEYDGFDEALTGTARLLRRKNGGFTPDLMVKQIQGEFPRITTAQQMYDEIRSAVAQREKLRATGGGAEAQGLRFWEAATDPKSKSGLVQITVGNLKLGDVFYVRAPGVSHEPLTVTHIGEDGIIQVKDGTSFGVQDMPEDAEIWVKRAGLPEHVVNPPPEPADQQDEPPAPPLKQKPMRNLTKAEQSEFEALTLKDRAARDGGPKLTTAETQRYQELEALVGAQDLLGEDRKASLMAQVKRLIERADEFERQAGLLREQGYRSNVHDIRAQHFKNSKAAQDSADALRREAVELQREAEGGAPAGDAGDDPEFPFQTEQGQERQQQQRTDDTFDQAARGDDAAWEDLFEQFQNEWREERQGWRGRPNPHQVHTPEAFVRMFNAAYAKKDFDAILNAVKASDASVYKPFLKELFRQQASDPIAADKAEWMRSVFNGTVPKTAVKQTPPPKPPPQQPPPPRPPPRTPPRPGPTPGPTPPPRPPGPTPKRIKVAPIAGGSTKSPYKILADFSAAIGKSLRILRMKRGGLGYYAPGSTTTAQRFASDLDTAAHELAGHWTDDKFGIGKPWITPRTRSPYDGELSQFWPFGSVTPRTSLRYNRAEGIAEYIRAYVMNPAEAKAAAPNFTAYFERTVGPKALQDIKNFSDDVRRWAGTDPLARAALNIRMEPPTFVERLKNGLRGRGFGFETGLTDKLRLMFDDPYHYAVKAAKQIKALRGEPVKPSDDFELTARLLATHDARMADQFERGLTKLRPGQFVNRKGTKEVQRIVDPVTGRVVNLEWLMDWADKSSTKKLQKDLREVSAYMVAQRTIEKAEQFGRSNNLSGIGAGIYTDVEAAQQLLDQVNANPELKAKLDEGARRYRLWADQNIKMLVDSGRLSWARARDIKRRNEYYVDMHRLSEDFDTINRNQRGGLGTTKDVIKRFKGSTLELENVYSNLLEQTDSIQKEAHRNVVMNNFTDSLRNTRSLHGPNLKDFDVFGRKGRAGDKNTIAIYKDGRKEVWQFAPEIFESLKGLGELNTNWLFSAVTLPSKFARYMITRGPSFMIRNPLRDTFERTVNSKSGSKPWDIFQGYSQEELSRYEVFGGGQFGNYIVDNHVWNREIKQVMRKLSKDPTNILLSPLKLKNWWEQLSEKSEKLGRIAEFRRAYDAGRKKIAADFPGITEQELDYQASLYAAGEARGLLDFAKAGTVMRYVNQAVPFSNASMRGLGKTIAGFRDNPGAYAMRWGLSVLLPTMAVLAWNRRDEETWKEYLQLPAYRRDMFWNLKVGDQWVTIPKPHLLGVLAGGVERIIIGLMGEEHAGEGFAGNVANQIPINNAAQVSGPLKAFLELAYNFDTFRQKEIVPSWERNLDLDLRKGTKFASPAGQGIANAMNVAGLGVDSRSVDYVLNSLGGWGTISTSLGAENRDWKSSAAKATGLLTENVGTNARDVQWMLQWAKRRNELNNSDIKELKALRTAVFEEKDATKRAEKSKTLREYGTRLREIYDK